MLIIAGSGAFGPADVAQVWAEFPEQFDLRKSSREEVRVLQAAPNLVGAGMPESWRWQAEPVWAEPSSGDTAQRSRASRTRMRIALL